MTGVEISVTTKPGKADNTTTKQYESFRFRGTAGEFLRANPEVVEGTFDPKSKADATKDKTVVVCFNPGYGSGDETLLRSWIPDLEYVCICILAFSCLNCCLSFCDENLLYA